MYEILKMTDRHGEPLTSETVLVNEKGERFFLDGSENKKELVRLLKQKRLEIDIYS